ncbi:MAG: helix-turn-helix domain-containing protein [Clostridia bacterium]|nr:helix-turn-helix domain-containing protein [Clostridia bacterium]
MKKRIEKKPFKPLRMFHMSIDDMNMLTSVHHHTAIEISCVISGKGVVESARGEFEFETGDVMMFSPNDKHRVKNYTDSIDILCLHFEPHYIWSVDSGFSDTNLLSTFLNRNDKFQNRLDKKHADYVYPRVVACETELINLDEDYEAAIKANIVHVLLYLLRYCGYVKKHKMSSSRLYNLENLKHSMEYIDSHPETDLDLDVIAQEANMSRSYFCTVFKRYNGIKPWDYITIKRIDKAIMLLGMSGDKKLNIAFDCGFHNTANFYRAFKKITGKAPGDYESGL